MVGIYTPGALMVLALVLSLACGYSPANRELQHASGEISKPADVKKTTVEKTEPFSVLASDTLTSSFEFENGKVIRFARVGYHAFGPTAVNVVVAEAGGLVPRVATCTSVDFPNFHRDAAFGHHFSPTLVDVNDALKRWREVLEEVQFWPQCPQSWELQDKRGVNYRYCVRRKDSTDEPPRPAACD